VHTREISRAFNSARNVGSLAVVHGRCLWLARSLSLCSVVTLYVALSPDRVAWWVATSDHVCRHVRPQR